MSAYCMKCMCVLNETGKCTYCGFTGEVRKIPHQLCPGTILNQRYLVGNSIGQGGFGITYIGLDMKLGMRVAIKEFYPNGYANRNTGVSSELTIVDEKQEKFFRDGRTRFYNEARAVAKFSGHHGIVDVRDFFEENNTAYIVMEYLEGKNLREYIKENGLFTPEKIMTLLEPVFEALEKVHEEHIIHRDISPDNIMILKDGSAKLMDFGAARVVDYSDQKSLSIILKAGYAPEEQYRAKGMQGPWTDIYALCATIYKCITGITPDDALQRCFEDTLKPPSVLGINIDAGVEAALQKGLAVRYQERCQTIAEFRKIAGENGKEHSSVLNKPEKKKKRIGIAAIAGSVCAVLLICGLVFGIVGKVGKTEKTGNVEVAYPTERVMTSDAVELMRQMGMEGALTEFVLLQEEWNEKFLVYSATCEVTIRKGGAQVTYTVKLLYELEKVRWKLSEESKIIK